MPALILIIEDNVTNMELMTYLLDAFGYAPVLAHDGEQGLSTAYAQRPDLILCDVHLPNRNGYSIVQELKHHPQLRDTPVVAVTALAMVGDRERLLESGFDGYISKPINPASFIDQVECFLQPALRSERSPASVPGNETPHPAAARGAAILLLGRRASHHDPLRRHLEMAGYRLMSPESVDQYGGQTQHVLPELIVYDMQESGEVGVDVTHSLAEITCLPDVPVVVLAPASWPKGGERTVNAFGEAVVLRDTVELEALVGQIEACLWRCDTGE